MMNINKPKISMAEESNGKIAKFVLEPLEQGYGLTLGNALRRVLLSNLPGVAVSGVKINGVLHEFSTIKGVKEDVAEIVLNLKSLVLKSSATDMNFAVSVKLKKSGAGEVHAKDIEYSDLVEVVNKDLLICTCDSDAKLDMELFITRGMGYKPASEQINTNAEIGYVAIDAIYSPVIKVNYNVESARVGQNINYDRLILEVETNGGYSAKEMVALSAKSLEEHVNLFVEVINDMGNLKILTTPNETSGTRALEMTVEDMDLSARSSNCLTRAGYNTVADIVNLTREELGSIRNLGLKSAEEIEEKIIALGLKLKEE